MDITAFFTMQQGQKNDQAQLGLPNALTKNEKTLSHPGFVETMFEQLISMHQNHGTGTDGHLTSKKDKTAELLGTQTNLVENTHIGAANIIDIAGMNMHDHQAFLAKLTQTLSDNQDALNEVLQPFENLLTTEALNTLQAGESLPSTMDLFLPDVTLKDLKDATFNLLADQGVKGLALNLTPEQITQAQAEMQNEETSGNSDILAGIGLVKMLPPQAHAQTKMDAGNAPQNVDGESFQWGSDFRPFGETFKDLLAQGNKGKAGSAEHLAMKAEHGANIGNGVAAHAMAKGVDLGAYEQSGSLRGWPFSMDGSLLESLGWSDHSIEDIGAAANSSYTSNTVASLTNISTFAGHATQTHPGTAMVAATMTKAASTGETKAITLQLEPPELGRVEVKMEFGENKEVKAILKVEKPETLAMLQRDAVNLERALQDAGLEVGDNALSFELAEDGNFSHDGGHDGTNGGSSKSSGDLTEDDMEIIESTMNWQVDPDTGHTSYDIIA